MQTKSSLKVSFLINGVLIQSFFQILIITANHNGLFSDIDFVHNDRIVGVTLLVNMVVFVLVLLNIQKLRKAATHEFIIEKQRENFDNLGKLVETIQQQKHDFMNHLQVINGFSDLGNYEELNKYVKEITHEVRPRLQLMQVTRLEIKSLLLVKAGVAKENGIDFRIAVEDDLEAFPLCRIQAVNLIGNLIDNAFKAASTAESPFVKIYMGYENGCNVLRVYNNGDSIPKELGDEIFYKGYTTKKGSSGLGLYIIKSLIDEYNGTVLYSSNPDTGTEFIIRIPVASDNTVCEED